MKDKWIVNIFGGPDGAGFEIALVRESNKHGQMSYGWFGKDKLYISYGGVGGSPKSMHPWIWKKLKKLAKKAAKKLNRLEKEARPLAEHEEEIREILVEQIEKDLGLR